MPLTRAQRNAAAEDADAPAASSSQAPARRAFGAVDNQRKGKRKAAAKKEPAAREVRDRVRASSRAPALFFLARARSRTAFEPRALNGTIAPLSARNHAPKKPSVDPRPRPPR